MYIINQYHMWIRISLLLTFAIFLLFTNKMNTLTLTGTKIQERPIILNKELLYEMTIFYDEKEHNKVYAQDLSVLMNYKPRKTLREINSNYAILQCFSVALLLVSILNYCFPFNDTKYTPNNNTTKSVNKNMLYLALVTFILGIILMLNYEHKNVSFKQKIINSTPVVIKPYEQACFKKLMFETTIEYDTYSMNVYTDNIEKAMAFQPEQKIKIYNNEKIIQIVITVIISLGTFFFSFPYF